MKKTFGDSTREKDPLNISSSDRNKNSSNFPVSSQQQNENFLSELNSIIRIRGSPIVSSLNSSKPIYFHKKAPVSPLGGMPKSLLSPEEKSSYRKEQCNQAGNAEFSAVSLTSSAPPILNPSMKPTSDNLVYQSPVFVRQRSPVYSNVVPPPEFQNFLTVPSSSSRISSNRPFLQSNRSTQQQELSSTVYHPLQPEVSESLYDSPSRYPEASKFEGEMSVKRLQSMPETVSSQILCKSQNSLPILSPVSSPSQQQQQESEQVKSPSGSLVSSLFTGKLSMLSLKTIQEDNLSSSRKILSEDLGKTDSAWLQKLREHPEEEQALLVGHLHLILNTPSHRFGNLLPKFIGSWLKTTRKLLAKKFLSEEEFSEPIRKIGSFMTNLILALFDYYKELRVAAPNAEQYGRSAIEELLFPKIFRELFELFKKRYHEEDIVHHRKLNDLLTISPAHLGIAQPFWLLPEIDQQPENGPYQKAISILQLLPHLDTPAKKVGCLVDTAKAIVSCVNDHWKNRIDPEKIVVGGDELIPLFSYVIIRASIPYIYSENRFMEAFLSEKSSLEQEGYLLATFQTCLIFSIRLNRSDMEQSATQILSSLSNERQADLSSRHESLCLVSLSNYERSVGSNGTSPSSRKLGITVEILERLLQTDDEDPLAPLFPLTTDQNRCDKQLLENRNAMLTIADPNADRSLKPTRERMDDDWLRSPIGLNNNDDNNDNDKDKDKDKP